MSIIFDVKDHVATVTLNRPEAMNSIDPETNVELLDIWQRISDDSDIRAAILTGAGERAFCTGGDLKKTMPPRESFASQHFGTGNMIARLAKMAATKPVIAAINGYALGGGLELALLCDIRIASSNAVFGLPEVRVGSLPGAGGTQRLIRTIGQSDAMLMMLTGERIDAEEARRIGLISRITEPAALMETARAIALQIVTSAPLSVAAVKRVATMGGELPLSAGLELEQLAFGALRDTQDRIEGRVAFAEKRKPVFKGK